jgi:hypothetical protein
MAKFMTKRRRLLALSVVLALVVALAGPAARWRLIGWWNGEPFWKGRPASYYISCTQASSGTFPIYNVRTMKPVEAWVRRHLPPVVAESVWGGPPPFSRSVVVGPAMCFVPDGTLDPAAIPVLAAMAGNADAGVRWWAAVQLERHGAASAPAVRELIRLLDDREAETRYYAASTLGKVGRASSAAVPKLRSLIGDDSEISSSVTVGRAAAEALRKIEPDQ